MSLPTIAADVKLGNFFPDPEGEHHIDVAVALSEGRVVSFFRGDGTGKLQPERGVALSPDASFAQKLAVVDLMDGPSILVVAAAVTVVLVFVRWAWRVIRRRRAGLPPGGLARGWSMITDPDHYRDRRRRLGR